MIDLKKIVLPSEMLLFYHRSIGHPDMFFTHDEYVIRSINVLSFATICIADEDRIEAERNAESLVKRAIRGLEERIDRMKTNPT